WGFLPMRVETYNMYADNDLRREATCWDVRAYTYTERYQDTHIWHGKYGAVVTVAEHDGADATYNELVYWMLHSEMLVIGSYPLTSFKTGFDDYRKDVFGMKGLKNLISHILEISDKE
ncbi:MAG: hypothetical protein IIT52_00105, partial [Candidatus Methanomethylophilus sp.]|nr:hypothetical protein [Methanomethylophilus sp.]